MLHHRSEVFKRELRTACDGMRWLLGWESDPLFLACSGTGAMEASLLNIAKPGDSIISVNGGVFGGRWAKIAERLQLTAHEIEVEWGTAVSIEQVRNALTQHPKARAFCVQHTETSTTVLHPLQEVLQEVKKLAPHIVTIVDGISSCATVRMPGNSSTIDIFIAGSQKALMLPPGLAIVALSEHAWEAITQTPRRTLYFDFLLEKKALASGETSWTPPSTLIVGLNAAVQIFREEGLTALCERHQKLSKIAVQGTTALGCAVLAKNAHSPSVTGFFPPSGIDADKLRNEVRAAYGIRLAGGQGAFKGKIVRIGHMGFVDPFDVVAAIGSLGLTINKLGGRVDVSAAMASAVTEL